MSIHKKILKTYETLYKYNKNNKFSQKKNRSFIHLYLLLLQNKYRLNFDFKNYPKNLLLYQLLNDLYSGVPIRKSKGLLFSDDKLLGDIFFIKDNFNIEKYLTSLEELTYNLNYVNTNIQLVDYLGNTENDVTVTKIGLCLLVFTEQFPLIKINSRLIRNIINHLVRTAEPRNNYLTYINSVSVFLLQRLNKLHKFTNYPKYIELLIHTCDNNGIWKSGYNNYLVENSIELDILHSTIALINMLDYQINKRAQEMKVEKSNNKKSQVKTTAPQMSIFPSESGSEDSKIYSMLDIENEELQSENKLDHKNEELQSENKLDHKNEELQSENKLDHKNEELMDELTEEFSSFITHKKNQNKKNKTKKIIERFDNLSEVHGAKFYFDLNFYNTTLILVLVLVAIILYRYQLKV